jgi:hypothetical protein
LNVPVYYIGQNGPNAFNVGINAQVTYFIKQGDTATFYVGVYSGQIYDLRCLLSGYHS